MISFIVAILIINVSVVVLLARRSKKTINFNGICSKECIDCEESSWCTLRYK